MNTNSTTNDLIDAKLEEHQLCGSKHCPGCGHKLEGSKRDWVGLPAGVKFDPTDQELIEHLEAKVEQKSSNLSHPLIDEFIPTIEGEDGICYTHPEKLPGVTRDGLSRHFFHRPSKAYTTGTRKRRKIQTECDLQGGETRWHKTGKTRPVMLNGQQKGCKKILVLYTNFGKNRKPEKTNWVMHQYHLGQHEEEREGELVVSKIFYQTQPRQCNWTDKGGTIGDQGSNEIISGKRESGIRSISYSNNKEVINNLTMDDHIRSIAVGVGGGAPVSSYATMDMQQHFKDVEQFGFVPFRRGFDEAGIGDASSSREAAAMSASVSHRDQMPHHQQQQHQHQHHQQQQHYQQHQHRQQQYQLQQHQGHHHNNNPNAHHVHHVMDAPIEHQHHIHQTMASAAFHLSTPSQTTSQTISPPAIHHASLILGEDSFHASRIMLQNEAFQQQQQQTEEQQHDEMGGRSAAGLEEIIMGCSSSSIPTPDVKEKSTIANTQEVEWLKYSTFWPDSDNPDHHG